MDEILGSAAHPEPQQRLFTVAIPVYNGKALLRNCLRSVLDSTLSPDRYEVLVADDASTEPETLAILREFEERFAAGPGHFRVLWTDTNSGGAARPRNRILDAASGEYVFFVDSDDTIGSEALERIADAVAATPSDWIALHQAPVNGRTYVATVGALRSEVSRVQAMATLTVHKVFRRAELDRQRLRFDEGLTSGEDVPFTFSYLVNAARFLMLGGYDFYYLTQHADDPDEPAHLSRRARTAVARIERDEKILRSMLTALRTSDLPESEQREVVAQVVLPRVLLDHGYLKAVVEAEAAAGEPALRRLADLLADPVISVLDPTELRGLTAQHLAAIAAADWFHLAQLMGPGRHLGSADDELSGALTLTMESLRTLQGSSASAPPPAGLVEVAAGRPFQLSSAFGTSSPTGVVRSAERYFFHTGIGTGEWIRVDLGRRMPLRRIEVTNRRDGWQERARHLFVALSDATTGVRRQVFPVSGYESLPDGSWQEAGVDLPDVAARYVLITSPMRTALHFSELRIYTAVEKPTAEPSGPIDPHPVRRALQGVRRRLRGPRRRTR